MAFGKQTIPFFLIGLTLVDLTRWWGYAVGRWEGDTFVVDSIGHDERTWVAHFGYPHSDQMHLQDRYHRVAYDTLEAACSTNRS